MKRVKQFSIWIIALLAMTVTNYAWAADTQKPKPGCNGDIQIGTVTGTTIAVSWCKATDNVTPQDQLVYWVLWKLRSESSWKTSSYTKNMTSYTITGLEPNTEYDVMVAVHDAAVNGINYKSKRVRTNAPPVPGCNGKITVTEITADRVKITWCKATDKETPQNELQYKIWRKDIVTGEEDVSEWVKDPDYGEFRDLIPNRKYQLDVKVKDASGNEKWYGEITVQTDKDTQKPMAGTFTVGTVTTNSIALSWTKGTDDVTPQSKLKHRVWWENVSSGNAGSSSIMTDITSYTITGLLPNTEYKVNMAVYDQAGNWRDYGVKTVKTKQAADTQDPTPGTLTVGTVTTNSIALSWTKGTDNITPQSKLRYNIMWKKLPDGVWEYSHESNYPVDITSYTITGLQPNTEYKVDVSVRDEANNSVFYGEKKVKTKQAADTQDPKPGTLTVGTVTTNSIALSWTKGTDNVTPQNKLKYMVWWKKSSDSGDWQNSGSHTVNMTSYTITGLQPDTEYKVDVRVYDEADNWRDYGEKTVKTKQAADTQSPTPGTLTVGTVTTNSIALSWTRGTDNITPQNKLRYRVAWKKTSDPDIAASWKYSHPEDNPAVDMTSYTITGLQPNTEYIVDVQVWDEVGRHKWYGEKKVKTKQATTPSVPVTGVTLNRNSVTIDGDYSTIQLTATVHPSNASDKSLTWASSDPTVVSVDSKGLVTIHKKGKARVTATANDGSGQSDTCLFDVIRTVANETVDGLRVYAHGSALYLTLPKAETIHIYNVGGSLVKTLALPAGDHVQPLAPGVYLVRVGEQVTKILVK